MIETQPAHTPASPVENWRIEERPGGLGDQPAFPNIIDETGHSVVCQPMGNTKEAWARARLIVASPALREALKKLLDRYLGLVNSGDAGNWDPETEDEVIAAHAALALVDTDTKGQIIDIIA